MTVTVLSHKVPPVKLQRTVELLLLTSPEEADTFAAMQTPVTDAYNAMTDHAWHHGTDPEELHEVMYRWCRERYALPSQFVCGLLRLAIGTVNGLRSREDGGEGCKQPESERIPIPYDARTMRVHEGRGTVSFTVLHGPRMQIRVKQHRQLRRYKDWETDSGKVKRNSKGQWILLLTFKKDMPAPSSLATDPPTVVGCDRGIVHPAVLSDGRVLGDPNWHRLDRDYFRTQRSLQAKGTKSAKRRLKRRSGKWSRFRAWADHNVTKQILKGLLSGTILVLEDLTNIRTRMRRFSRKTQRRMHAWSFHRQQEMLTYKAPEYGVRVVYVNPRHTSQRCSCCGFTARSNRKSQSVFHCGRCDLRMNADLNAAINIAALWITSQQSGDPMVVAYPGPVNPPHAASDKDVRTPKVGRGMRTRRVAKVIASAETESPGL